MSNNKKRDITSFFSPKSKRTKQEEKEEEKEENNNNNNNNESGDNLKEITTTETTTEINTTTTEEATEATDNKKDDTTNSTVTLPVASPPPPSSTPSTPSPYDLGTWNSVLEDEFNKTYFRNLMRFVSQEYSTTTVYPPREQIFSAFTTCDFNNLKVVIIGQDPYHGPNQAHGLSFSVLEGNTPPPSLRNIFKEAQDDVRISKPKHGNLTCWSKQGVFLLNTVLTVRSAQPNSHQNKGWEEFTDAVIRELNKKDRLIFILWGKPAQTKCKSINQKKHLVITSSHPSPLGATKTNQPFIGSKCFSRCNNALREMGKEPINWEVVSV